MSLSSVLGVLAGKVSGFITKDVEPAVLHFLGTVEHDVVAVVIPLAAAALGEIGAGVASGQVTSVGAGVDLITSVAKATLPKVEAAAIQATEQDIVTASMAAIAAAKSALGSNAAAPAAPAS